MKSSTFSKVILAIIGLSLLSLCVSGQSTDATMTTQANVIRNETSPGGNTRGRIADMYQALIDSKVNVNQNALVTASGTDTYTATITPAITTYAGLKVYVIFTNANTGAVTINFNGLGSVGVKKNSNEELELGDINAGQIKLLAYDGSAFQLIGIGASDINTTTTTSSDIYIFSSTNSDISGYETAKNISDYVAGAEASASNTAITSPTLLEEFATEVGFPGILVIPSGEINLHYEVQKSAGSNNYFTFVEIYKRNLAGTETLIATSENSSQSALNTRISVNVSANISTPVTMLTSDRIVAKVYAQMLNGSATVTVYYDNGINARIELPVSLGDVVTGPSSATDNAIPRFDGATGKTIQNSALTIDDAGNLSVPNGSFLYNTSANAGLLLNSNNSVIYGGAAEIELDNGTGIELFSTIGSGSAIKFVNNSSLTNTVSNSVLEHITSGTPANGIGSGLVFQTETSSGNVEPGSSIESVTTDVTPSSEDFDLIFKTMAAGATAAERVRISSTGAVGFNGANYGTSGQVLTSNGSGSPPSWGTAGDVVGPAGATDNAMAVFDTGTGKLLKNSNHIISAGQIQLGSTGSATSVIKSANGNGLEFQIIGANASSGNTQGGNITLIPGNRAGSGAPGSVRVQFQSSVFGGGNFSLSSSDGNNIQLLTTAFGSVRYTAQKQNSNSDLLYFQGASGITGSTSGQTVVLTGGNGFSSGNTNGGDTFLGVGSRFGTGLDGSLVIDTQNNTGTLKINSGSNEQSGLATLVAGTVTVNNTKITSNTYVMYSVQTAGGTQGFLSVTKVAGTSFTIDSSSATDTSTIAWLLIEPN